MVSRSLALGRGPALAGLLAAALLLQPSPVHAFADRGRPGFAHPFFHPFFGHPFFHPFFFHGAVFFPGFAGFPGPVYAPPLAYYPPYPPPPAYYYPPTAYYAPPDAAPPAPVPPDARPSTCRSFQTTVPIDGKPQRVTGTACLQPDGSWRLTN